MLAPQQSPNEVYLYVRTTKIADPASINTYIISGLNVGISDTTITITQVSNTFQIGAPSWYFTDQTSVFHRFDTHFITGYVS